MKFVESRIMMLKNEIYRISIFAFLVVGLHAQSLNMDVSNLFMGPGYCAICHTPGSPNTSALTYNGVDISMPTHWRSTMMANSAKDPLWQAKVSAEVAENPNLTAVIEDKCTTCHAPMGRTEAHYNGSFTYTMAQMNADPLAMDGVSCTVCHQIQADNLGTDASYSGHYEINNSHVIFGPYTNLNAQNMFDMTGYTASYGPQMETSELCATCHTLFTPYVDSTGTIMGEAPEQTDYLEWLNSDYPAQNIECQTCHMPVLGASIVIANQPMFLQARSPFFQHFFVGGNSYMLGMLKEYRTALGVTASLSNFNATLARTADMLTNSTANIDGIVNWTENGKLDFTIGIENLTGHKFPTAYPSRRAWLEVIVENSVGDTVFHSGEWTSPNGVIIERDTLFEPHYDLITEEKQVQIYQSVPKDMYGDPTWTLLRIAGYIKDNRIPPKGFRQDGSHYDSTRIEGNALSDMNFNQSNFIEGTGIDSVKYLIDSLNIFEDHTVKTTLWFQSISPNYIADLNRYDTPQVNQFLEYYETLPNLPVLIKQIEIDVPGVVSAENHTKPQRFKVESAYPNPFNPIVNVEITVDVTKNLVVNIFDARGNWVTDLYEGYPSTSFLTLTWNGTNYSSGLYFIRIENGNQNDMLKVTLLK